MGFVFTYKTSPFFGHFWPFLAFSDGPIKKRNSNKNGDRTSYYVGTVIGGPICEKFVSKSSQKV